jgi:IclR family KDG regulon transcriptional repressor
MTDTIDNGDSANLDEGVATVAAASRALKVLRCFSTETPVLGASAIGRSLQMHKSTVHRLLVTLEREGFVYQVEPGRYALSYAILELASAVISSGGAREIVLEHLGQLVKECGETAHFAVMDSGQVLYLEKVEGTWALRMPSAVGRRVPLNCTALGKVLLGGLPDDEQERIAHSVRWKASTSNTLVIPADIVAAARTARSDGYAIDREEIEFGLVCIAAPVVDHTGQICGGISISGPTTRMDERLDELVRHVRAAAELISSRLGPRARTLSGASFEVLTTPKPV